MINVVNSRVDVVMEHIQGKSVLDIGCCGMGVNDEFGGVDFIFGKLKDKGYELTGIDINDKSACMLRNKGFNVVVQDAQEVYDLNKKFDTVISEENIEHIANLKTYLENVRRHMHKDSKFVLSTPNAFCFDFFAQTFLFGKRRVNNFHTHYHGVETITYLLESNGFKVEKVEYCQAINKMMNLNAQILKYFLWMFPSYMGRTMIVVAR